MLIIYIHSPSSTTIFISIATKDKIAKWLSLFQRQDARVASDKNELPLKIRVGPYSYHQLPFLLIPFFAMLIASKASLTGHIEYWVLTTYSLIAVHRLLIHFHQENSFLTKDCDLLDDKVLLLYHTIKLL